MVTINGVENTVEPGRPVSVINGGKFNRYNGIRPHEYDKWRMVWNGNHFAPPPAGAVLWYPGVPGQGTVIQDFAERYADSGIDTDEELDISETAITCDADASTACPAGSIIVVDSEKMYVVSVTTVTLTVARGYNGSVAATHSTNANIWVWIPNNGTITGAVWKRRPSGVLYLDFDGNDFVKNSTANWQSADETGTIIVWAKYTTGGTVFASCDEATNNHQWGISLGANVQVFAIISGTTNAVSGNTTTNDGVWHMMAWVSDGSVWTMFVDLIPQTLTLDFGANSGQWLADVLNRDNFAIGSRQRLTVTYYTGSVGNVLYCSQALTASEIQQIYQQHRSLYGV